MFRLGMGAAALPLVGLFTRGLAGLTKRIGPAYALLLRLWIAAGLAAIALGGVQGLSNTPLNRMRFRRGPFPPGLAEIILPKKNRFTAVCAGAAGKVLELRAAMSMARLWRDRGKAQQARELRIARILIPPS